MFPSNAFIVDSASGWGFNVTDQSECSGSPNVVYASIGGKGLTDIAVSPGG